MTDKIKKEKHVTLQMSLKTWMLTAHKKIVAFQKERKKKKKQKG